MVHARHRHMVRQSPRRRHDAGASGKLGRIPDAASCSSDFDVFDVGATPSQAEVMASPAELMVSHNLGGGVPRGSVVHVDHAMGELTYLVRTTSTAGG